MTVEDLIETLELLMEDHPEYKNFLVTGKVDKDFKYDTAEVIAVNCVVDNKEVVLSLW